MNEPRAMTDDQLGAAIAGLREEIAWPAPLDVASAVGVRLRDPQAPTSRLVPRLSMPSRRRAVLVIAVMLLALATVAIAARLVIKLGAVEIQVRPGRSTALPTNVVRPDGLGREVKLAEADEIAGFAPALPAALETPMRTWVDEAEVDSGPDRLAPRIVTAWAPSAALPEIPGAGAGALLMQFEGQWEVASKELFAETNRFGAAHVGGRDAFWTTGEHQLALVSGEEVLRLLVTGNVLIWQEGPFTFRLETDLPKKRAIAIGESIRP